MPNSPAPECFPLKPRSSLIAVFSTAEAGNCTGSRSRASAEQCLYLCSMQHVCGVDPDEWWGCMTLATRWFHSPQLPTMQGKGLRGLFGNPTAPGPKRYFPAVFRYLGPATRPACLVPCLHRVPQSAPEALASSSVCPSGPLGIRQETIGPLATPALPATDLTA